ncbi:hypothetical protein IFM51744_09624 [Aspergillus udagawae]|uniref:Secreted protein CSS2 C-terminal domain-containing protein n=1 Tax=Aspergillus udagawae TaxID=91492 RepID=A0ABQ1AT93_9EURO|nr:hypothetical protein IFM51744_09624 [Aspergillus udagawae]GFF87699.1 hypothetical protein IFM53868_05238 [Aspergillus udagawae]
MGPNLTVTFDIVSDDYLSLYTNNTLGKRTGITTVVAAATIVNSVSSVILAANARLEIYEDIAAIIKSKSNQNSCSWRMAPSLTTPMSRGCDSGLLHREPRRYMDGTSAIDC